MNISSILITFTNYNSNVFVISSSLLLQRYSNFFYYTQFCFLFSSTLYQFWLNVHAWQALNIKYRAAQFSAILFTYGGCPVSEALRRRLWGFSLDEHAVSSLDSHLDQKPYRHNEPSWSFFFSICPFRAVATPAPPPGLTYVLLMIPVAGFQQAAAFSKTSRNSHSWPSRFCRFIEEVGGNMSNYPKQARKSTEWRCFV